MATAAGIMLAALAPPPASATTIELGATSTPITTPACPKGIAAANCTIILTQATGLETLRDSAAYPTTVRKSGILVAWTVGLATLSSNRSMERKYIHQLDASYGGTTSASVVVLKPGKNRSWTVVAQSPLVSLQPFLGMVVQFPLTTPLKVTRGETIGLSVPHWAPVLDYKLPSKKFAYRQSRMANCSSPAASEQAQLTIGANTRYLCNYPGTRVEYSATEIPTPVAPKGYVR
ncbi:MAG: hypothetical protein ACR2OB_15320 [Solirubrobacteraceae bacterium]